MRTGMVLASLWGMLAASCTAIAQPGNGPQFNSNDFNLSAPATLDSPLPADGYYARIIINSAFDGDTVREIDRKGNSRWRRLSKSQKRGMAVIPKFEFSGTVGGSNNFQLPSIPLLSLGVDTTVPSSSNQPWNKRDVTQFQSPWFSLGPNSSIKIKLEERSLRDDQWRLFQNVLPTITAAAGGFFSIPVTQRQATGIDGIINFFAGTAAPGSVASSNELRFDPLGTGEYAYRVEYYDLTSKVNRRFGYSDIRIQFKQSHRSQLIIRNGVIEGRTTRITPSPRFSSINLIPSSSPERTLQSLPIYNGIRDAVGNNNMSPADFTDRCNTFRSEFKTAAGLTDLDANLALLESLNDAGWSSRPKLLRSNCFGRFAREQLSSFGFALPEPDDRGGRLRFTGLQRKLMGQYLRAGILDDQARENAKLSLIDAVMGDDIDLSIDEQAEAISGLSSSYIDPEGLMDELKIIDFDRYCCWSTPKKLNPQTGTSGPDRTTLGMVGMIAPDDENGDGTPELLAVDFSTTGESADRIGRVLVRKPTEAEERRTIRRLCRSPNRPDYLQCDI